MVLRKQSKSNVIANSLNSHTKSFIGPAFYAALTLHPLNLDEIPDSYSFPMIYLFLISAFCTTLAAFNISSNAEIGKYSILRSTVCAFCAIALLFAAFAILCFLISYFGAKVAGIEHSAKQFALNTSSFVFIPISILVNMFLFAKVSGFVIFGISMLAIYYVQSVYEIHFPYATRRESVIHHVYIFVTYLILLNLSIELPSIIYRNLLKV